MAKKEDNTAGLQLLKDALKQKRPHRLYFFYGEETFLMHYYLDKLKKMLVDELTESFNYNKLTEETFALRALADSVESLPMMAEHTFVWVDDVNIFELQEDDRAKLVEVFSDIPDYCTVVFSYETKVWDPDKRFKKLWDAISTKGQIVEFAKRDQRELTAWIQRHFAANKKTIDPKLCAYLIDITGGTMTALYGEISKICAYSGSDAITKSDIDAVVEPVLDAEVFNMAQMLGEGNYGAALVKLRTLLKMQEKPIAILGAISRHFRNISAARILMDNGRNAADLMQLCGLYDSTARKTMEAAKRFSAPFCAKASEMIMETDRALKTSLDTPERLMELLILRLAQEARNG